MIDRATGGSVLAWGLAVAFLGGGFVNLRGPASIREGFVRWGYPAWWNIVTGALELLTAALIAIPSTRVAGLVLGAAICLAAVATVVRHREYPHMAPGAVLIALAVLDLVLIGAF